MAKLKNSSQLVDALDGELAWRKKEIATFRVASARGGQQGSCFTRAGVALLYAHWEGFIKKSAELYLEFVSNQSLTYEELQTCFIVFGVKGHINGLVESRKSQPNIEALNFIMGSLKNPAVLSISGAINTDSNLSSAVFENIASSVGISTKEFETKFNLIDSSLVDRRNKIAHGEYLSLKAKDFGELVDEILGLMSWFKNELENAAILKAYKRGSAA